VFGRGSLEFVRPANRAVLGYVRQFGGETILCVANLSRSAQAAELDLSAWAGSVPQEMLGRARFPRIGSEPYAVTLAPYGFFWFQLIATQDDLADIRQVAPEFVTLVINDGWNSFLSGRTRQQLERDVLPSFLAGRRWFAGKDEGFPATEVRASFTLEHAGMGYLLALVTATGRSDSSRYFLPLTLKWTRLDRLGQEAAYALAGVRRGPREGSLLDATADAEFIALLLTKLHRGDAIDDAGRTIAFVPTEALKDMTPPAAANVRAVESEQSNTTAIVDGAFVVKFIRRITAGIHPEIEVGKFLLESGYANAPALLGSIELHEGEECSALAVVHRFVENQGDAWTVTNSYLDRFIDEQRVMAPETAAESPELASYLQHVRQIGRRTAELHMALAGRSDIAAFAPEPVASDDLTGWTSRLRGRAGRTLDMLIAQHPGLSESGRRLIADLLDSRAEILRHVDGLLPDAIGAQKIRHHGDYHLGQILIAKDDVFILDFEGEPKRLLAERRAKAPAARDVAGLVRSVEYSVAVALERTFPGPSEEREHMAPKLDVWRNRAVEEMLNSYRASMTDSKLWPGDTKEAEHLLDFFVLEKAFYEIQYEMTNRPAWLHVPLEGLWRILKRAGVVS
jgi:maltose alpha-D-glucosyltransferase/alpha-amylase